MIKASEKLLEKRIELGLSLDKIEKSTKIKEEYLDLIEKGKFSSLPSGSHISGFVKNYAQYLGIPEKEIMPLFRREFDEKGEYMVLPKSFESKDIPLRSFKLGNTLFIAGVIFVLFIAYLLFQYRYAFINPPLDVYSPKDRSVIEAAQIEVKGKTEPDTNILINKETVTVEASGTFSKTISVFPGNFVINLEAVNKFGKKTSKKIVVEIKSGY